MVTAKWVMIGDLTEYTLFFMRTRNLNLSLGVLTVLADFRLKSSYFVLNFFPKI